MAPSDAEVESGDSVLVVDVANVVGSRADGWWRDRVGATRRLLAAVAEADLAHHRVVMVLEGRAVAAADSVEHEALEVVTAPGSGDDEIARVAASYAGRDVVVVTADRELRRRVHELGARTVGPSWLWARLDGPTGNRGGPDT